MGTEREPKLTPRMREALSELEGLIREHYPDAVFRVTRSPDDTRAVLLMTTLDIDDRDAVVDLVIDRVMQFQLEEHLPVHVIPVRPRERVVAMRQAAEDAG